MHFDMAKRAVAEFMKKLGLNRDMPFPMERNEEIIEVGQALLKISKKLEKKVDDPDKRFISTHLEVEELGEFLIALGEGDEVGILDGLADRLYIYIGTSNAMDMPISEAFIEVHKSNMTKEKQETDIAKARVREKGANFVPPNLQPVLDKHRNRKS